MDMVDDTQGPASEQSGFESAKVVAPLAETIRKSAEKLLYLKGFTYSYENLRVYCSIEQIDFEPSNTKTYFRDAIKDLRREGLLHVVDLKAKEILGLMQAETDIKRIRAKKRYHMAQKARAAKGASVGNVEARRDIESVHVYNGDRYSFSSSRQESSEHTGSKRSRTVYEAHSPMGPGPHPARSGHGKVTRAVSEKSTAGTTMEDDEDISSAVLPAKRAKTDNELADPFPDQNLAQPVPTGLSADPRATCPVRPSPIARSNILKELPGNTIGGQGAAAVPGRKGGLDAVARQLAPLGGREALAAADAAAEAALEEYDSAVELCERLLELKESGEVLEAAVRKRKEARAKKERAFATMAALRKRVREGAATVVGQKAPEDNQMDVDISFETPSDLLRGNKVHQSTAPAAPRAPVQPPPALRCASRPPFGNPSFHVSSRSPAPDDFASTPPKNGCVSAQGVPPFAQSQLGATGELDCQPPVRIDPTGQTPGARVGGLGSMRAVPQCGDQSWGSAVLTRPSAGANGAVAMHTAPDGELGNRGADMTRGTLGRERWGETPEIMEEELEEGEIREEEWPAVEGKEAAVTGEILTYTQGLASGGPKEKAEGFDDTLQPFTKSGENARMGPNGIPVVAPALQGTGLAPEDIFESSKGNSSNPAIKQSPFFFNEQLPRHGDLRSDTGTFPHSPLGDFDSGVTNGGDGGTKGGMAGEAASRAGVPLVASLSDWKALGLGQRAVSNVQVYDSANVDSVNVGDLQGLQENAGNRGKTNVYKDNAETFTFNPAPAPLAAPLGIEQDASPPAMHSVSKAQKMAGSRIEKGPPAEHEELGKACGKKNPLQADKRSLEESLEAPVLKHLEASFERFVAAVQPLASPAPPQSDAVMRAYGGLQHPGESGPVAAAKGGDERTFAGFEKTHGAGFAAALTTRRSAPFFSADPAFACDDISLYEDEDELVASDPRAPSKLSTGSLAKSARVPPLPPRAPVRRQSYASAGGTVGATAIGGGEVSGRSAKGGNANGMDSPESEARGGETAAQLLAQKDGKLV